MAMDEPLRKVDGGHVFHMWLLDDVFRKMHREKHRFENASANGEGRNEQIDAVLNFAIIAWHMTDWVWKQYEPLMRCQYNANALNDFQKQMKEHCADLAICDVLANALKHGGVARAQVDRPNVNTVIVADANAQFVAMTDGSEVGWSLRIVVDRRDRDPHEVLNNVFLFWHKFVQQLKLNDLA